MVGESCEPCGPQWQQIVGLVVSVSAGVAYIIYMLRKAHKQKSSPGKTLAKMLLSHMQLVAALTVIPSNFPVEIDTMFSTTSVSNINSNGITLNCLAPQLTYTDHFFITIGVFFVAVVLSAIGYSIWLLANQITTDNFWVELPFTIVVLTFAGYAGITKRVFETMTCRLVNGTLSLQSDLNVTCGSEQHSLLLIFGLVLLAIVVVGFPIGTALHMWMHRSVLYNGTSKPSRVYALLRSGYRQNRFWWESMVMMRKALVLAVLTGNSSNPQGQSLYSLFVLLILLLLHVYFQPYQDRRLQALETMGLLTIFSNVLFGLVFQAGVVEGSEHDSLRWFFVVVIFATNIGVVLLYENEKRELE